MYKSCYADIESQYNLGGGSYYKPAGSGIYANNYTLYQKLHVKKYQVRSNIENRTLGDIELVLYYCTARMDYPNEVLTSSNYDLPIGDCTSFINQSSIETDNNTTIQASDVASTLFNFPVATTQYKIRSKKVRLAPGKNYVAYLKTKSFSMPSTKIIRYYATSSVPATSDILYQYYAKKSKCLVIKVVGPPMIDSNYGSTTASGYAQGQILVNTTETATYQVYGQVGANVQLSNSLASITGNQVIANDYGAIAENGSTLPAITF